MGRDHPPLRHDHSLFSTNQRKEAHFPPVRVSPELIRITTEGPPTLQSYRKYPRGAHYRHLTRILSARKRKHPPAKAAWQARLKYKYIKDHVWEDAASRCTATPSSRHGTYTLTSNTSSTAPSPPAKEDSRTHRLTPQYGTLCRMCGLRRERKLPAHGGMQRDPQIIYAHQLTQGTRGPLRIPPHPRRPQAPSHPHSLRHSFVKFQRLTSSQQSTALAAMLTTTLLCDPQMYLRW
eukprot:scaffold4316_cov116-Isochrysis_galbana.AAC.3